MYAWKSIYWLFHRPNTLNEKVKCLFDNLIVMEMSFNWYFFSRCLQAKILSFNVFLQNIIRHSTFFPCQSINILWQRCLKIFSSPLYISERHHNSHCNHYRVFQVLKTYPGYRKEHCSKQTMICNRVGVFFFY